ncbi:MAG TPA: hypothetical protein VF850_12320 [Gemmatimonadaceae bacterium]
MMVLSALRPDAGLFEFLAHRARSAPARRLGIDAVGGAAILAAALRWNPAAQPLIASAAALLFSYGAWGLLDRASSRVSNRGLLRTARLFEALRVLSAIIGVMAAAGVLLAVWAIALGTWIS